MHFSFCGRESYYKRCNRHDRSVPLWPACPTRHLPTMNYFAHALPFLDRPYFVAGTAVPDWLTVCDRPVRVRMRHTEPWLDASDQVTAAVAGGAAQHLRDDARFHGTRAFAEIALELTVWARDALGDLNGFRPSFLGHLLVEVLLDASLVAEDPRRLEAYYAALAAVDAERVQQAVNRIVPRATQRLAPMIVAFRQHCILWDYLEDGKLMVRLNQVMRRVQCAPLPASFAELLPAARRLVANRRQELLEGTPNPRSRLCDSA
jgi:hypothetical protein